MIRILIVDDHEVVRAGVKALVNEMNGWDICGEAANGLDAVALAAKLKPDVILMDVSMPGMSGIEAAKAIRNDKSSAKIVLLSMHDRAQVAAGATAAGVEVDDCLCKDALVRDLKRTLSSMVAPLKFKSNQLSV